MIIILSICTSFIIIVPNTLSTPAKTERYIDSSRYHILLAGQCQQVCQVNLKDYIESFVWHVFPDTFSYGLEPSLQLCALLMCIAEVFSHLQ